MEDWLITLPASVQEPNIAENLLKGHRAAGKKFKVHLDDYNFLPHLAGQEEKGPRKEFFYFNDDAQLTSIRYNRWKAVFLEQRAEGQPVWRDP